MRIFHGSDSRKLVQINLGRIKLAKYQFAFYQINDLEIRYEKYIRFL